MIWQPLTLVLLKLRIQNYEVKNLFYSHIGVLNNLLEHFLKCFVNGAVLRQ